MERGRATGLLPIRHEPGGGGRRGGMPDARDIHGGMRDVHARCACPLPCNSSALASAGSPGHSARKPKPGDNVRRQDRPAMLRSARLHT
eukprot:363933-Chlamydomonas_euryale.AAC.5